MNDSTLSKNRSMCKLVCYLLIGSLEFGINSGSDNFSMNEHYSNGISKQDFKILKVVGRGSFGKVYLV